MISILTKPKNHLKTNSPLFQFVDSGISNATISISKLEEIPAMQMCQSGKLEGWCWQSTTFLSVFFDHSIVSRGKSKLYSYSLGGYFHSWIEILYKNKEYVFDPALCLLISKKDYYSKFVVELKAQIEAEAIMKALSDCINNKKESPHLSDSVYVSGTCDVADPLFRVNSEVSLEKKGEKIKKLNARFCTTGYD